MSLKIPFVISYLMSVVEMMETLYGFCSYPPPITYFFIEH